MCLSRCGASCVRGVASTRGIVRPGRQALTWLATGQRVPHDFALDTLLGELGAQGLTLVGIEHTGWRAQTGLVGDVIGVARAT